MGGCRCTYRTCSVKSDGKTHMFHYPVFEKARCHQWILNAQRFEFFNLTVSQVRNRVVCQHHFKNECFMNYKKDKLTFNAIPTIDGPYCDSSNEDKSKLQAAEEEYSFIDVDNQTSYIDKKACSSVKYIDFLGNIHEPILSTKNENWQHDNYIILPPTKNHKENKNNQPLLFPKDKIPKTFGKVNDSSLSTSKENKTVSKTNDSSLFIKDKVFKTFSQPKDIPEQKQSHINNNDTQPCLDISSVQVANTAPADSHIDPSANALNNFNDALSNYNFQLNPNVLHIPSAENINYSSIEQPLIIVPPYTNTLTNINEQTILNTSQNIEDNKYYFHFDQPQNKPEFQSATKKPKIQILSEKRISDPLPFIGKLEPVPPSLVLCIPDRYRKENVQTQDVQKIQDRNINTDSNTLVKKHLKEEIQTNKENNECQPKIEVDIDFKSELIAPQEPEEQSPRKKQFETSSLLKRNLPPERIAAIEQKRIFNRKLRDIYESCLGNSDKSNKSNVRISEEINESAVAPKDGLRNVLGVNAMKYFDARMTRMENILAKKIEQNSKRILDLKNSVTPLRKVTTHTQTTPSEDSYKKYLYQEISKFLSPNTNSLVYEELFINKYAQKFVDSDNSLKKKRKKR